MKENRTPNKLINESSPYLLQHAYNPVKWHPWTDSVLEKAKNENKLIIVSIGYAACHWCHVMERESFEDEKVAELMNEMFICIKVDREERPDIDAIYMNACQLSGSRSCGWPLNAFALPDGRPFWAGTYFPKQQWKNILQQFAGYQENDPNILEEAAKNIHEGMKQINRIVPVEKEKGFSNINLSELVGILHSQMDLENGGSIGHPKFPMPVIHDFLLDYYYLKGDSNSLSIVDLSLKKMAYGGIFDQIGGGFSRYSVDEKWFAPHFEKMLYDNAQLISLYSKAYLLNGNESYKEIVEKSMVFIQDEMRSENGAFFSSLDADSEGQEGKYYTWTYEELSEIFNDEAQLEIFSNYYNIDTRGNWENGRNILYRQKTPNELALKYNMSGSQLKILIEQLDQKLLEQRKKRIKPGLDNKVLTSWNSLMLKGCLDAYMSIRNEKYLQMAYDNVHFIIEHGISDDNALYRSLAPNNSKINAFLDDYAHLINALCQLYQIDFNMEWLDLASKLSNYVIEHFYDKENHIFYYTSKLDRKLISRHVESSDNVIPGSFSSITAALNILAKLRDDDSLKSIVKNALLSMNTILSNVRQPAHYSKWFSLILSNIEETTEVIILGPKCIEYRNKLMSLYRPNTIFSGGTKGELLPIHKNRYVKDKTLIYICKGNVCSLPIENIGQAMKML